jgi:hypothetical protein
VSAGVDEIARATLPTYVEEFADGVPAYFHSMSERLALAECVAALGR